MPKRIRTLLWKLSEATAKEISDLRASEELNAWLDEQSEPAATCYATDLSTAVNDLERELVARGLSVKTH